MRTTMTLRNDISSNSTSFKLNQMWFERWIKGQIDNRFNHNRRKRETASKLKKGVNNGISNVLHKTLLKTIHTILHARQDTHPNNIQFQTRNS